MFVIHQRRTDKKGLFSRHVTFMYANLGHSVVFWQLFFLRTVFATSAMLDAEQEIDQFLREQRLEDLHRKIQALTPGS